MPGLTALGAPDPGRRRCPANRGHRGPCPGERGRVQPGTRTGPGCAGRCLSGLVDLLRRAGARGAGRCGSRPGPGPPGQDRKARTRPGDSVLHALRAAAPGGTGAWEPVGRLLGEPWRLSPSMNDSEAVHGNLGGGPAVHATPAAQYGARWHDRQSRLDAFTAISTCTTRRGGSADQVSGRGGGPSDRPELDGIGSRRPRARAVPHQDTAFSRRWPWERHLTMVRDADRHPAGRTLTPHR
jgi:hypothetical protein